MRRQPPTDARHMVEACTCVTARRDLLASSLVALRSLSHRVISVLESRIIAMVCAVDSKIWILATAPNRKKPPDVEPIIVVSNRLDDCCRLNKSNNNHKGVDSWHGHIALSPRRSYCVLLDGSTSILIASDCWWLRRRQVPQCHRHHGPSGRRK